MNSKLLVLILLSFYLFNTTLSAQDPLFSDLSDKIDLIVDKEGTGDFLTVQEAIDSVTTDNTKRTVIYIKNGVYFEKVRIASGKDNILLIGENIDSTIIRYDDYASASGFECVTLRVNADNFTAINLTIENSYNLHESQALALTTEGDKNILIHCKLLGYQDTYFANTYSRAYLKDCFINGAVDYIYGNATLYIDSCQIHNIRQSGGYITAASTEENNIFGFVFKNCWITGNKGVSGVYLGRPWRPYARTVFMNCYETNCVSSAGWHNWGNPDNEETAYYAEYNCYGAGAATSNRVDWSYQLSSAGASIYTKELIFSKANNSTIYDEDWLPAFEEDSLFGIIIDHYDKILSEYSTSSKLSQLICSDTVVSDFHSDSLVFHIELDNAIVDVPDLHVVKTNPLAKASISKPSALPGIATINVASRYNASYSTYKVVFSYKETSGSSPNSESSSAIFTPTIISSQMNITIESDDAGKTDFILLNTKGQVVKQKEFYLNRGNNNFEVNTSELSPGTYIYYVASGNGMKHTGKVIKR